MTDDEAYAAVDQLAAELENDLDMKDILRVRPGDVIQPGPHLRYRDVETWDWVTHPLHLPVLIVSVDREVRHRNSRWDTPELQKKVTVASAAYFGTALLCRRPVYDEVAIDSTGWSWRRWTKLATTFPSVSPEGQT